MDLTLLYQVSYGLYVVSVEKDGVPTGCVVNTCMQITSQEPVYFAICLNKNNYTYELLEQTKRFSISILSEQTPPDVISNFGFFCGKDRNKFEQASYETVDGLPVLREKCCGALLFDVVSAQDMDTHVVVFGKLTDTVAGEALPPMTYEYYHKVIKGKAPKNAPTYQAEKKEDSAAGVRYVCTVCGYVHEGELADEPDDYVCPICGVPKEQFKKQS